MAEGRGPADASEDNCIAGQIQQLLDEQKLKEDPKVNIE